MWTFDGDVIRAGVAAGFDALDSASEALEQLREYPGNSVLLEEVAACLHRLIRTAATVGLREVGRSAMQVDDSLHVLRYAPCGLSADQVELLAKAVGSLRGLLAAVDVRTGRPGATDGSPVERLRAACV